MDRLARTDARILQEAVDSAAVSVIFVAPGFFDGGSKTMPFPEIDAEGYLVEPASWSIEWARAAAAALQIEMTEEHWDVLRFMRDYFEEHQVAPDARFVMRYLSETRNAPRNRLFELFPYGYPGQACKLAGMRRPRIWSTG
jgi:tRNA 2-thiouridine synthesizing protein E